MGRPWPRGHTETFSTFFYLEEHGVGAGGDSRVFIHPRTASALRVRSAPSQETRHGEDADGGPGRPRLGGSRLLSSSAGQTIKLLELAPSFKMSPRLCASSLSLRGTPAACGKVRVCSAPPHRKRVVCGAPR